MATQRCEHTKARLYRHRRQTWRRPSASLFGAVASAVISLLLPPVLSAQPHRLDAPDDSPLWWTLTDEVAPTELKRQYSNRSLSLERYDAAVEAGIARPIPERGRQGRECLVFYLNRQLTPELEAMWLAFRSFYDAHLNSELMGEEYVEAVPHRLRQFDVSASGVATILRAAEATKAEVKRETMGWRIGEATLLIEEVYADPTLAASAPPKKAFRDAFLQRDYSTVATVAGRPESEIRELVDAYANWDAPYKLIAEALPVLKTTLSEGDWQGFRQYLLEVVVARKGNSAHFDEFCGE